MNTYATVKNLIAEWKQKGMTKAELAVKIAEACLGWPYVWGGYGQTCNPSNRRSYAERSSCPAAESAVIISGCQVLRQAKSKCDGCTYYPGGNTLFFDCRGFTRWVLQQATDWTLQGAGATSQWNDASNWKARGPISEMPADQVCCVFMKSGDKMSHTGLHVGGGNIIHCSGTVKRGMKGDRGWTHYAIPVSIDGKAPEPTPGTDKPTLRRGSTGEYVTLLQTKLIQLGYNCGATGADGKYGDKTVAAVKAFQKDNDLKVDGVCGPATWNALDSGKTTFYTVTIQHVSKSVADGLITQYGGSMKAEG
jgi:cell wall-associated NlpC family hydrolase